MTRALSATLKNHFTSDETAPFFAVDMAFESGNVRLWTGVGDIDIGGDTFLGAGQLLSVSSINELQGPIQTEITVAFAMVPAYISLALGERNRGRVALMYFGAIIAGAAVEYQLFRGLMDPMRVIDYGASGNIEVPIKNILATMTQVQGRRLNNQFQQNMFSGDKGLEFVPKITEAQLIWSDKAK